MEKFRLSVDTISFIVTDEELSIPPHSLLPNSIKVFLHSERSIKSQALMPAKALPLQLHIFMQSRGILIWIKFRVCRFAKSQLL